MVPITAWYTKLHYQKQSINNLWCFRSFLAPQMRGTIEFLGAPMTFLHYF